VMQERDFANVDDALEALNFWDDPGGSDQTDIKNDPVVQTLKRSNADQSPWYNLAGAGGGIDLGGRNYQEPYEWMGWVSYDRSRRGPTYVSRYQWRAPGEWFAEVYSVYYQPDANGNTGPQRQGLCNDAAVKAWFDNNAHNA